MRQIELTILVVRREIDNEAAGCIAALCFGLFIVVSPLIDIAAPDCAGSSLLVPSHIEKERKNLPDFLVLARITNPKNDLLFIEE